MSVDEDAEDVHHDRCEDCGGCWACGLCECGSDTPQVRSVMGYAQQGDWPPPGSVVPGGNDRFA